MTKKEKSENMIINRNTNYFKKAIIDMQSHTQAQKSTQVQTDIHTLGTIKHNYIGNKKIPLLKEISKV